LNSIIKKFPHWKQIALVYAVAVVMIYAWSLLHFFWRLPSWLYFSTVGEIVVILAYLFSVNFLESILVLLAPVFMSIILPQKWFHDRFVTKGILLVSLGMGYLLYFDGKIRADAPFPYELAKWTPLIFVPILVLVFLLDRVGFIGRILEELADRLTIFLYIFVPLTAVSLLIVLIRNFI
jgi:hypothetical protein